MNFDSIDPAGVLLIHRFRRPGSTLAILVRTQPMPAPSELPAAGLRPARTPRNAVAIRGRCPSCRGRLRMPPGTDPAPQSSHPRRRPAAFLPASSAIGLAAVPPGSSSGSFPDAHSSISRLWQRLPLLARCAKIPARVPRSASFTSGTRAILRRRAAHRLSPAQRSRP